MLSLSDDGARAGRYLARTRRELRAGPRGERWIRPRRQRRDTTMTEAAPATEPGRFTEWHDMSPGEQLTAWAQLRAWVTWLTDRYELTVEDRLPRCWAQHPGLVEELWALRAWRLEIYGGGQLAPGQAARYWHAELRQVLHAAATVYAAGCRAGHRSASVVVSGDPALQETWAQSNLMAGTPGVETAAGWARRAGTLASPERMAAEFDSGTAVQVAGMRDYLYCDGAWWVPSSAGWLQVPVPASAPAQGDDSDPDWAGRGFAKDAISDRGSEPWGH